MAAYDNKVLTGDQLVYYSGLVKTAIAAKQDALAFNTAYNASSNKVATMSDIPDISGKQDTIVFNTTYNASTNKAATMSDLPDISGKQDALVFNTAYNASSNKVATMSDITSALSGISSFSFEIVEALPSSNISTSKIYLVAKNTSGTNQVYTEYAYVNNAWEIIGDTSIAIDTLSNNEVQTIWNAASAS